MKKIIYIVAALAIGWYFYPDPEVRHGPGVTAGAAPVQVATSAGAVAIGDYRITPLADFNIRARVLARKDYRFGREADLSPVDLALGWGRMSDESVLDQISISQSNRWYHWRVGDFPIPRSEIENSSANMHLIPATDRVEEMIEEARKGDVIELAGQLVRVDTNDGWRWASSLTRDDIGARSCELIYVREFRVVTP